MHHDEIKSTQWSGVSFFFLFNLIHVMHCNRITEPLYMKEDWHSEPSLRPLHQIFFPFFFFLKILQGCKAPQHVQSHLVHSYKDNGTEQKLHRANIRQWPWNVIGKFPTFPKYLKCSKLPLNTMHNFLKAYLRPFITIGAQEHWAKIAQSYCKILWPWNVIGTQCEIPTSLKLPKTPNYHPNVFLSVF